MDFFGRLNSQNDVVDIEEWQNRQRQTQQPKKKQKDFWTDQISTAGGVIGGIAGLPFGLFGAAGGSAVGSGLGEALENILLGEDPMNNVVQEAALGGVLGGGPLRLGGAILGKVAPRAGQALEQTGKNLLGTQANLTRAEARQLGSTPADVMGQINQRTGLTNLDSMATVGQNVTGSKGALSELTRNAIGNTSGVDLGDLRTVANDLLTDKGALLSNATRKNIVDQVSNSAVKAYGGSKGSLNPLANPYEAFDVARNFESQAARIRGAFNASPADQQAADIYQALANTIKDRLFAVPGVNEGVQLAKGQAADAFRQLAKTAASKSEKAAYEKLAKESEGFTDVAQVRSAQAPFVKLGKIDEATARAQSGAAAQMGDNLQGLGKVIQRPTNLVALPLNAATPAVGGLATRAGRALQGTGSPATARGIATRVGAGGVATGLFDQATQQPASLEDALIQQTSTGELNQLPVEQTQQQSPYSIENLRADIQRDPKNAQKYMEYYQLIQETFGEAAAPELSSTQQATALRAQNALNDIGTLEQAIESGNINKTIIPGSGTAVGGSLLGTTDIESALFNIGDVVLRSRTGAQAPEAEIRKFVAGFLPRAGESKESQMNKLKRAYRELAGMVNPPAALGVNTSRSGNTLEAALLAQQGN